MSKSFGDKLDDLDLTPDEVDRLNKCMKDEKFRTLFKEYAEEISKPENRKQYEEEIATLERERGMDVKFINPTPGHVLKTSIVDGNQKCFINICTNEVLGKPKSQASVQGKTKGMQWAIPHSVSQAREDIDRSGNKCVVYDVVFHPDTYYMLTKNERFKQMIHDTAIDAVERRFEITLDKDNVKAPKMKFKGTPKSSVIRTPSDKTKEKELQEKTGFPEWMFKPRKYTGKAKEEEKKSMNEAISSQINAVNFVPEYSVTHRGYFDMQDFSMIPGCKASTRPRELIVNVSLPKITAANSVNLEIFEKRLLLHSAEPVKYKLDIDLPYPVDEHKGFAKFDKSQRKLVVTLEVLQPEPVPEIITMLKDDRLTDYLNSDDTIAEAKGDAKSKSSQPKFDEDNRIHYKQGPNYKDEEEEEVDTSNGVVVDKFDRSTAPLVNTSKYLIEMIYKHESLVRKCPKYNYFQDDDFVTIILDVSDVYKESIWYVIYDDKMQFACLSENLEDNMINTLVSFWACFGKDFLIDPSQSSVDITSNNVVFALRKANKRQKWHYMTAGLDLQRLERRLFATNLNICDLFCLTHTEGESSVSQEFSVVKVNKSEKDFLILELEPKVPRSPVPPKPTKKDEEKVKIPAAAKTTKVKKSEKKVTAVAKEKKPVPSPATENLSIRKSLTSTSSSSNLEDSDDDLDDTTNTLVVDDNGKKEVVTNHKTKSAVKLSTAGIVFDLE